LVAVAVLLAYSDTFSVPFLLDDPGSIAGNPTLRHLSTALRTPLGTTVSGRPVLNLSLAANYALGGTAVAGYHAVNLAVHILAGLVLFGLVRRASLPRLGERAATLALGASLLWTLHPLLTSSVTYVIQRAESLMGLWYLLTLYCLVRGASASGWARRSWYAACVAACVLGMGTKEVMATAPVAALLLDRTLLSGSFRGALRERLGLYAGLAATWIVVPALVLSTRGRAGSAGFGSGVSPIAYALTQSQAVAHYLRLAVWPSPLAFDYGTALARPSAALLPPALAVLALLAATLWALARRPVLGLLGACFFMILAPSSSFIPVATEPVAEHRMYLPLVPVAVLAALALTRWLGRRAPAVFLVLAAALGAATWERNRSYQSAEAIWADTVAKLPGNARAQNNLGSAVAADPARLAEAVPRFEAALRLQPDFPEAHYNLAHALDSLHRTAEAVAEYRQAIRLRPGYVDAHCNLGNALMASGKTREAIAEYREAIRLGPDLVEAHFDLGNALGTLGDEAAAMLEFTEALRLDPRYTKAEYSLGNALAAAGRPREAVAHFQEAIRQRPDMAEAQFGLGDALRATGRAEEALAPLREAVRLRPGFAEAHCRIADILASRGDPAGAVAEYEEAVRERPSYAEAECNLGGALSALGRFGEALPHFRQSLRLRPDSADAYFDLGNALAGLGRFDEALGSFREAVRLRPAYTEARCNLASTLGALGRDEEAIGEFRRALGDKPGDPVIHLGLAVSLIKAHRPLEDAVSELKEVLRLQPQNDAARQILGRIEALPR
jgi:tetratricopeptide (TPR) repeat protein